MTNEKDLKLAVAVVSHDSVPALFAYDLAMLMQYTRLSIPDEWTLGVTMQTDTYVHLGRQELLKALLDEGATHILWLDSDMRFPRDAFIRLLSHPDVNAVGCNYAKRGVPGDYVALKKVGGERLVTAHDSTGLEEVEAVGFGCLLLKSRGLKGLPPLARAPWFYFQHINEHDFVGEDVYFCNLLRESGTKIYVDHDLSKEIGHLGQFDYRLAHVEATRGLKK
jgi:hypothetical protein